mgnify:CR=1 FL=1
MRNVYTVKQVNLYIKNMFTQDFMLNRIYVKGEVSNCKYHTSGHIYFSLKDESGTIACIMFASARSGLSFRMREGQKVVVLGSVNVYERDGKYQLYANEIILEGAGLLYEKFEALKQELEEMGMFADEYKQPIPKVCQDSRDRDRADGSGGTRYHPDRIQKKPLCAVDPLSRACAGRGSGGQYCPGNPDDGKAECRCDDRRSRRRFHRGSMGI